jgi:hypothetical protein
VHVYKYVRICICVCPYVHFQMLEREEQSRLDRQRKKYDRSLFVLGSIISGLSFKEQLISQWCVNVRVCVCACVCICTLILLSAIGTCALIFL